MSRWLEILFFFSLQPSQKRLNSNLCQTNHLRRWNLQSDLVQVPNRFKPSSFPVFTNQFPIIIMLCLHVHNSPQHQREKSLVLSFNRTSEHVLHLFHILLYYVTQIRLYGNRVKKVTLKVLNRCFAFYNVLHFYYVLQISCTFLYQQSALSESFIC